MKWKGNSILESTNAKINDQISPVWWSIINNVKQWKSSVTFNIFSIHLIFRSFVALFYSASLRFAILILRFMFLTRSSVTFCLGQRSNGNWNCFTETDNGRTTRKSKFFSFSSEFSLTSKDLCFLLLTHSLSENSAERVVNHDEKVVRRKAASERKKAGYWELLMRKVFRNACDLADQFYPPMHSDAPFVSVSGIVRRLCKARWFANSIAVFACKQWILY